MQKKNNRCIHITRVLLDYSNAHNPVTIYNSESKYPTDKLFNMVSHDDTASFEAAFRSEGSIQHMFMFDSFMDGISYLWKTTIYPTLMTERNRIQPFIIKFITVKELVDLVLDFLFPSRPKYGEREKLK